MNLYLIKTETEIDYNQIDAMVIAAATNEQARHLASLVEELPKPCTVTEIGSANRGVNKGVIITSFNAG